MHKSGVRGYLQNNFQFSKCSYHNISVFMSSMKKQDRYCFEPNGKYQGGAVSNSKNDTNG